MDNNLCIEYISIHALRVEGDYSSIFRFWPLYISIHALRVEGDFGDEDEDVKELLISIHALRVEGDQ